MRLSAHLPPARHRRPIIWIAPAAAVLMILSAAFSQPAERTKTRNSHGPPMPQAILVLAKAWFWGASRITGLQGQ